MKHATRAIVLAFTLALTLQGCARGVETGPSYLGMLTPDEATVATAENTAEPLPELRHVGSNKVLGAMAFQKTTGRAIDPSRLQGNR